MDVLVPGSFGKNVHITKKSCEKLAGRCNCVVPPVFGEIIPFLPRDPITPVRRCGLTHARRAVSFAPGHFPSTKWEILCCPFCTLASLVNTFALFTLSILPPEGESVKEMYKIFGFFVRSDKKHLDNSVILYYNNTMHYNFLKWISRACLFYKIILLICIFTI